MERIRDLIDRRFTESYLGMEHIAATGKITDDTEILKAYLGVLPDKPYFGDILAVMRHGGRFFVLVFHVWQPRQKASDANRLSEIQELRVESRAGLDFLGRADTDFGLKAFWLHTPDSCLDTDALVLRTVARALKQYSVDNKLCARFRKKNAAAIKSHGA